MKILAVDTSSVAASVAICDGERLIGEFYSDTKKKHSGTLMPMVERLLALTDTGISDIDLFAVTTGPGSFTGLRIGMSAVKGMAFAAGKDCVGVPTLNALAYNLPLCAGMICAVMDARRGQVYAALFDEPEPGAKDQKRLTPDMAVDVEGLKTILKNYNKSILMVGDGAQMCYNLFHHDMDNIMLLKPQMFLQRASSVAALALSGYLRGEAIPPSRLNPAYLRLPQAQRELDNKNKGATLCLQ